MRDFCRGQIAHYKIPRYIRFVDGFPMTVTGKIQKFLIREAMVRELHDLPRRLPPDLAGRERARLMKHVIVDLMATGTSLEAVAAMLSDPALVVTPAIVGLTLVLANLTRPATAAARVPRPATGRR